MDRVLRAYAHTAWTPADPLAGLDEDVRRAILFMPSTFRERWKLAPWTDRHQRRLAIADIVAERRLLYELTQRKLAAPAPGQAKVDDATISASPANRPLSPFCQYRQKLHHEALQTIHKDRSDQDSRDLAALPEAKADRDQRDAQRRALLAVERERAKLDLLEFDVISGDRATMRRLTDPAPSQKKRRERSL